MNKQGQVILLAEFTPLLDSTESLKPEYKVAKHWKEFAFTTLGAWHWESTQTHALHGIASKASLFTMKI